MKRTFLFIVLFISSVSFLQAQFIDEYCYVFSATSPSGHTLYYDTIGGHAIVTYQGRTSNNHIVNNCAYGHLIIPDSVTNPTTNQTYPVTQIRNSTFFCCSAITAVTIPSTIKSIGSQAFRHCTSLSEIYYNADSCGNVSSSSNIFDNCPITTLVIGNNVRYIPAYIFLNMSGLSSVTIPDSVIGIGTAAFGGCSGITTLTIGRGLRKMGIYAFNGCSQLSTLNYNSDSCFFAGNWTNNTHISNINIGSNVRFIPNRFFYQNTSLTSFIVPSNIKGIGNYAFNECTALTNITFHDSLTFIGAHAFNGCTGLSSITLFESIDTIGNGAFMNCTSLSEFNYQGSLESWGDIGFGDYSANPIYLTRRLKINDTLVSNLVIPNTQSEIKPYAFCGDTCIEAITIPESVLMIGTGAFNRCTKLTNIVFPSGLIHIGNGSFSECDGLTSVIITDSMASIGDSAFSDCIGITSISIPCAIIGGSAFRGCSALNSVNFSNSNVLIGDYAFCNCIGLTSVFINGSIIGNNAFKGCTGLTYIIIGNSVAIVGDSAFMGCLNVDSVKIGGSVLSIGALAFYGCSNITKTIYMGSISDWCSINFSGIYSNPIIYSHGLYNNNTPITRIEITDSISHIGNYAFYSDSMLTNVQIMGSVTKIGQASFFGCTNIDTLFLGRNIDTIMSSAFYGCTNLWCIKLYSSTPPKLMSNGFQNISNYARFYTPCNSISSYSSAWGNGYDFRNWTPTMEYSISVSSESPLSYGSASVYETNPCTSTAVIYASAQPHFYFAHWNDGVTTNPRTIVLEQDTSFVATFGRCSYTITCNSSNATMGSVSGGGTAEYLDTISITATANQGFHFTHWQDNDTNSHRTITVTSNKTYTAYFGYTQYSLSVNTTNPTYGTVTGSGNYHYNTTHSIGANANYGYHFTMWSDGNTSNPRTITLTQDTVFTAIFAKNQYSVTLQSNDATHGSVSGGGVFDYLDTATITATPVEHYHFVHWSDGSLNNPRQYIVTDNTVLEATFAIDTHIVSVVVDDISHGNVYGEGNFEYGQSCTLSAIAFSGFQFVRWSNGMTYNPYTFAVLDDVSLVAEFRAVATITATSNDPTMGTVTGSGVYGIGENVVLSANAYNGYHFDHWNDGITQNPRSFTADSSITLIAFFAPNTLTYTVSLLVNDYSMGTVTGDGQYEQGTTVTCAAVPYNGYHFERWSDNNTQNPRNITINSDITLTAYFAANAGIDYVDDAGIIVYAKDYQIHIDEAFGKEITVYTIDGRAIASLPKATEYVAISVTTTGVYIVKIGDHPARKVVVIR